jgi:hypothetical protein
MLRIYALFAILLFCNVAPAAPAFDWAKEALKLTGESDLAREKALKKIKRHPKIKKILKAELQTSKKALALDVISALKYRHFVPELLRLAETDDTGAFYLTVNSLLTPKNARLVIDTYKKRLDTVTHPVSQVVILDTLGAVGSALPEDQIKSFLENRSPEVRSAALGYIRAMVLKTKKKSYASLMLKAFDEQPFQLRMQAVYLASEMDWKKFEKIKIDFKNRCDQDPYKEVRDACFEKLKEPQ